VSGLRELADGLWVSQTPLWKTNALLARSGSEALLCDPCYTPEEIEHLVALAREGGGPIHLLLTHADFDHTCGIGFVPDAVVVAGASTAARIASGSAEDELAGAGAEWGVTWPRELRVDRVVEPGAFECGAFEVVAVEASGHTADGLSYVLVDQGVLFPGDYLSDMTYPFIGGGLQATIGTVQRLLAVLEQHALRWVVPGHGRVLTPEEATAVGEADLAYLEALAQAVAAAEAKGLSPGPALLHVYDVEPPRGTTPDFEIYGLRSANARSVLAHA
jgi:hydroxyacylglutathione hydrolase